MRSLLAAACSAQDASGGVLGVTNPARRALTRLEGLFPRQGLGLPPRVGALSPYGHVDAGRRLAGRDRRRGFQMPADGIDQ